MYQYHSCLKLWTHVSKVALLLSSSGPVHAKPHDFSVSPSPLGNNLGFELGRGRA